MKERTIKGQTQGSSGRGVESGGREEVERLAPCSGGFRDKERKRHWPPSQQGLQSAPCWPCCLQAILDLQSGCILPSTRRALRQRHLGRDLGRNADSGPTHTCGQGVCRLYLGEFCYQKPTSACLLMAQCSLFPREGRCRPLCQGRLSSQPLALTF